MNYENEPRIDTLGQSTPVISDDEITRIRRNHRIQEKSIRTALDLGINPDDLDDFFDLRRLCRVEAFGETYTPSVTRIAGLYTACEGNVDICYEVVDDIRNALTNQTVELLEEYIEVTGKEVKIDEISSLRQMDMPRSVFGEDLTVAFDSAVVLLRDQWFEEKASQLASENGHGDVNFEKTRLYDRLGLHQAKDTPSTLNRLRRKLTTIAFERGFPKNFDLSPVARAIEVSPYEVKFAYEILGLRGEALQEFYAAQETDQYISLQEQYTTLKGNNGMLVRQLAFMVSCMATETRNQAFFDEGGQSEKPTLVEPSDWLISALERYSQLLGNLNWTRSTGGIIEQREQGQELIQKSFTKFMLGLVRHDVFVTSIAKLATAQSPEVGYQRFLYLFKLDKGTLENEEFLQYHPILADKTVTVFKKIHERWNWTVEYRKTEAQKNANFKQYLGSFGSSNAITEIEEE